MLGSNENTILKYGGRSIMYNKINKLQCKVQMETQYLNMVDVV